MRVCSIEDCPKPARVRGLCSGHYQRHKKGREVDGPLGPAYWRGERWPRLSFEPVAAAAAAAYAPSKHVSHVGPVGMVAAVVGVHRTIAHRWHLEGVPLTQADRVADALGVHPAELWPEWIDLVAA